MDRLERHLFETPIIMQVHGQLTSKLASMAESRRSTIDDATGEVAALLPSAPPYRISFPGTTLCTCHQGWASTEKGCLYTLHCCRASSKAAVEPAGACTIRV